MNDRVLFQVSYKSICAGVYIEDSRVVGGAPIFKKFIGKTLQHIKQYYGYNCKIVPVWWLKEGTRVYVKMEDE